MLEDGRVGIEGISATSAGAMNAVVLAHGYEKAGREGAREALADFWSRVAHAARAFPLAPPVLDRFVNCAPWKALFPAFDVFLRLFSPYQFNPVNFNRPTEILDRSNEISFNSSLIRETRTIEFITRLIDEGKIADRSLKRLFIHALDAGGAMPRLGVASKLNADWAFLTKALGEARSARWIDAHFQHLSQRSTADFSLYPSARLGGRRGHLRG